MRGHETKITYEAKSCIIVRFILLASRIWRTRCEVRPRGSEEFGRREITPGRCPAKTTPKIGKVCAEQAIHIMRQVYMIHGLDEPERADWTAFESRRAARPVSDSATVA